MRAFDNFEQLVSAGLLRSGLGLWVDTGQMDQARQALSELDKRFVGKYGQHYPNFTVQLLRQLAYAFSSNPQ